MLVDSRVKSVPVERGISFGVRDAVRREGGVWGVGRRGRERRRVVTLSGKK